MAPLDELTRAYDKARRVPRLPARADGAAQRLRRPPDAALLRRAALRGAGRRAHLPQARGPAPHRRAQDQQRRRPGLLARRMGKERVIAETGAGQHGVATATAAAALGLSCIVYMGSEDMRRQRAQRRPHAAARRRGRARSTRGSRTLKDAINEAMRDWVTNVRTTHYVLGSVLGPDPFPRMVRDFHRVIGDEARRAAQAPDRQRGAGPGGRLRGRRQQRDRPVHRLPRRHPGAPDRRRGRRPRRRQRRARGPLRRRLARRAPRHPHLRAAGRGGADEGVDRPHPGG